MAKVILSEALIELKITRSRKEDVIRILAEKLEAGEYVSHGYSEEVIRREEIYATGLPTVVPVAICHTEMKHVNQSAMAVGTLASPVEFHEMGSPEKVIKAEIVFLLALKEPKAHQLFLERIAWVFKDRDSLMRIRNAKHASELVIFLKQLFYNII